MGITIKKQIINSKNQKIFDRIEYLANNPYPLNGISAHELTQNVISGLYDI